MKRPRMVIKELCDWSVFSVGTSLLGGGRDVVTGQPEKTPKPLKKGDAESEVVSDDISPTNHLELGPILILVLLVGVSLFVVFH